MSLPCFARNHGHPPGGGGFWLQGYRDMLREIRAALPPEKFLTTECNWEAMVADCDGLLMWHSHGEQALGHADGRLIPLFPAVYPGPSRTFGCNFAELDLIEQDGLRFAARMGTLLAWGAQLGWGDLTLLLLEKHRVLADYFARLCALRRKYQPYFDNGMMLRPPPVEPRSRVIAAAWQAHGGEIITIVVNPTRADIECQMPNGRTQHVAALEAVVIPGSVSGG
jgi:hypothetical protein